MTLLFFEGAALADFRLEVGSCRDLEVLVGCDGDGVEGGGDGGLEEVLADACAAFAALRAATALSIVGNVECDSDNVEKYDRRKRKIDPCQRND